MKCNLKELAAISDTQCVIEGRLNYKKTTHNASIRDGVFKERWFRLVKNYLFYFRLSDMGKFDTRNPAGVFILENSSVQMEYGQTIPFTFSLSFVDEPDKRHILAARTQEMAVDWVMKLRQSSYEYLRSQLYLLQSKIFAISGYDPLLLVPRNEGSKLWAPAVPFSTASACITSSQGFSCHVHSNGQVFSPTLDRSHSDALLAHRSNFTSHVFNTDREFTSSCNPAKSEDNSYRGSCNAVKTEDNSDRGSCNVVKSDGNHRECNNSNPDISEEKTDALITFSPTEEIKSVIEQNDTKGYSLEKSLTTSILECNSKVFAPTLYLRKAPSPPVRKKSPRPKRADVNTDLMDLSRDLATTSILDVSPEVPPRRKLSPKPVPQSAEDADNLIQF